MPNSMFPSPSLSQHEASISNNERDALRQQIHVLANKLLPITVFAQLALRHCQDPQVMKHLEKINCSAEEARVIVNQIQQFGQNDTVSSTSDPSSV
ncbi:MAG: hypothetical protein NPIRA05_10410 [Nitrospirales bacterium]|nr:MAG: hypothetical protein NPIRA05_10410 [Nitrospirales bacterium]